MRTCLLLLRSNPARAVASLAGWLREAGHTVRIVDCSQPDPAGGAAAFDPQLVLIPSALKHWPEAGEQARAVRAACDNPIAIFGPMPTLFGEAVLAEPVVDFALQGDPEETVLELLARFEAGKGFAGVPGLVWRDAGEIRANKPRAPFAALAELPPPAWDLLDAEAAAPPPWRNPGGPALPMQLSRGCSHAECSYCASAGAFQRRFRRPDAELAADRVLALHERTGVRSVAFVDEEFVVGRDWILDFCSALRGRKNPVTWSCEARPSQVDYHLLDRMHEAGCRLIVLGMDVLDTPLLRTLEKDQQVASCADAARSASLADIGTVGLFVLGLPGSSAAIDRATVDHALAMGLDEAIFTVFQPPPGSPQAEGWTAEQHVAAAQRPSLPLWSPAGYAPAEVQAELRRARVRWQLSPRRMKSLVRRATRTPGLAVRLARLRASGGAGPYDGIPGVDLP